MKRLTCFLILLLCFLISDRISGQNKQEITAYTERQTKLFPVIFSNPVAARNEINLLMIQGAKMPDTIQSMNWNLLGVYYGAINKLDSALFAPEKSLTLLPEK